MLSRKWVHESDLHDEMIISNHKNYFKPVYKEADLLPLLRKALDWSGLKVTNEKLQSALRELGPTGNTAEAYIVAMVEHGMHMRKQAEALLARLDATKGVEG